MGSCQSKWDFTMGFPTTIVSCRLHLIAKSANKIPSITAKLPVVTIMTVNNRCAFIWFILLVWSVLQATLFLKSRLVSGSLPNSVCPERGLVRPKQCEEASPKCALSVRFRYVKEHLGRRRGNASGSSDPFPDNLYK
jgi:hypothetical protein